MGYDMSVVDEQGNSIDGENTYWRRNISGAYRQAEKLVQVGMGYWSERNSDFPQMPDYLGYDDEGDIILTGTPPAAIEAKDPVLSMVASGTAPDGSIIYESEPEKDPVQAYEDRLHAYLKATYDERPGIAVYKLCDTNDGWWVTAAECKSALDLWEKAGRPAVDDFGSGPYNDTIPFLRKAAEHAGFRVW